jgi:hypothetical protein
MKLFFFLSALFLALLGSISCRSTERPLKTNEQTPAETTPEPKPDGPDLRPKEGQRLRHLPPNANTPVGEPEQVGD